MVLPETTYACGVAGSCETIDIAQAQFPPTKEQVTLEPGLLLIIAGPRLLQEAAVMVTGEPASALTQAGV